KTTKQLKGALKYPTVVIIVAFIVVGVLATFVLPAFVDLYSSLGTDLPALTRLMLSGMQWLSQYALYLMGVVLLIAVLGYMYTQTPDGRLLRDKVLLKVPVLGQCNHLNELVRCCRTMSILYRSGLPVTEIMSLVIENSCNLVIKDSLTQVQQG
ncbi:type II secretion system F family protein, partial [Chloroflexota bacterium]